MSTSWPEPDAFFLGRRGDGGDGEQILTPRRASNATLPPPLLPTVHSIAMSPPLCAAATGVTLRSPPLSPSEKPMPTSPTRAPLLLPPPGTAMPTSPTQAPSAASTRPGAATSSRLYALFFLIIASCTIGLVSVASLMQERSSLRANGSLSSSAPVAADAMHFRRGSAADRSSQAPPSAAPATTSPPVKLPVEERWRTLGHDLSEFECVGWRQTRDCSPDGELEPSLFQPCNVSIDNGASGFCEIRHRASGETKQVMRMHCDSLRPAVQFRCEDFASILSYGRLATQYTHDAAFSFDECRKDFLKDQEKAAVALPVGMSSRDRMFDRGIAIVVYEKLLDSVFASVRSLRAMGCSLPIELWYIAEETDVHHPILQALTTQYGAYMREIKDSRASRFYTKIYAVFYSAFDRVLLLDADNFAVRDPTYLFDTSEFQATGAMFWPDFWRFRKTIFNIQPTSFVWDVFDLNVTDMFEQESGQVLIDRRRSVAAMNVMMYYAFHPNLIEDMRLVWGDKDLFRFAWLKTQTPFHMIEMPAGSAGVKLSDRNVFCGVTMVQHDPNHEIIFLHRNQEKLTSANKRIVWQDIQQFKVGSVSLDEYDVRGANGGRYYPQFKRCYGKDIYYEQAFTVKPISAFPFAGLEQQLIDYVTEAASIVSSSSSSSVTHSSSTQTAR
ncbi:hypothetical protein P43SY_006800 [Pythium insidiosum]|uniref:Uncharacterized protein n=1 Tax=Pythium insidiosum TaxID=114742 RepID=A0AAD5Q6Z7_PYTIN|nr:hypothetical protein P43SY_006800 [Pythium insidiosum]